jgi:methyl-accepting chemotaxis protein
VIDSSTDIIRTINYVAADISNTVEQQAARITQITAHARNNTAGTVDTASAIAQAARGAADVSQNADQAAAGVEKVLAIIIQIREAVVNANTNAHIVNASAVELDGMAGQIGKMVGKFKI